MGNIQQANSYVDCKKIRSIYEVCELNLKWLLNNETPDSLIESCHLLVNIQNSIYMLGGVRNDEDAKIILVLRLEKSSERTRCDQMKKFTEYEYDCQSLHKSLIEQRNKVIEEERLQTEVGAKREDNERQIMRIEDALSQLPPLSIAPCAQLIIATKSMLWVKWPKVTSNSRGRLVGEDEVEYKLQVRHRHSNCKKESEVKIKLETPKNTLLSRSVRKKKESEYVNICLNYGISETYVIKDEILPEYSDWETVFHGKRTNQ